eukprot:Blabericola_migrator_1__600@NODE_1147_length_5278_cov_121_056227_g781_i0_p3_GENE_NODE_1147_length_5278_cov_121_056227_g781_i0NODE_1147_length_5278_cov_121_056227_g781_i0_p3_ORF_typecomplete_len148_score26_01FAM176/PF14851_6/0_029Protocadherin/PF08374_11/0_12_NODE_1147_length_5278_cov_121_056227_g781_i038434286
MASFASRLEKFLEDSKLQHAMEWVSNLITRGLYDPVRGAVYYNDATKSFAAKYPSVTALIIVGVISLICLGIFHALHMLFLRIHGPSRFHLASEDLARSKSARAKKASEHVGTPHPKKAASKPKAKAKAKAKENAPKKRVAARRPSQ